MTKPKITYQACLIVVLYALIYFVITGLWPTLWHNSLPGDVMNDSSQFLWNISYVEELLKGKQAFLKTDLIFYPIGESLVMHTTTAMMSTLGAITGAPILTINIVLFASFVLSAIGAFVLGKHFKLNIYWAFLLGFIFSFCPFKMGHLQEHYNIVQTAPLPFFILVFLQQFPINLEDKLFSKLTIKGFLGLVFIGIWSLITGYIITVYIFFFVLVYFLFRLWHSIFKTMPKRFLGFVCLTILVTILVRYLQLLGLDDKGALWWADDLMCFLTPNQYSIFYKTFIPRIYLFSEWFSIKMGELFIGFSLLISGVVALIYYKKNEPTHRFFLFFAIVCLMLCVPKILIHHVNIGYFPTAIIHFVPGINNMRIPQRFILLAILFFGLFTFSVLQNTNTKFAHNILPIILFVLLFVEYNGNPMNKNARQAQASSLFIKKQEGQVLLPIPCGIRDGNEKMGEIYLSDLYEQSHHKKKLMGGYISRVSDTVRNFYTHNKLMHALFLLEENNELAIPTLSNKEVQEFITTFHPDFIKIHAGWEERNASLFIKKNMQPYIKDCISFNDCTLYILKYPPLRHKQPQ